MKLRLERDLCGDTCSAGQLFIDDQFQCYTLEDKDRWLEAGGIKINGVTAIPRGHYRVEITFSNRFQRELPILLDVPGFIGVRIHPGNTSADTEGCILVGESRTATFVGKSRLAFADLFEKMIAARAAGEEITIEVA